MIDYALKNVAKQINFCNTTGEAGFNISDIHPNSIITSDEVNENGNGFIMISISCLNEAIKSGMIRQSACGGKRIKNFYFEYEGCSDLVLMVTDNIGNGYMAAQIIDNEKEEIEILSKFSSYLYNTRGHKFHTGRHILKTCTNKKYINTGTFLSYITGRIETVNGIETHHIYADWDLRMNSIIALTKKQHNDLHKETGRGAHRLDVKIQSLNQLALFLNFVNSSAYFNSFRH